MFIQDGSRIHPRHVVAQFPLRQPEELSLVFHCGESRQASAQDRGRIRDEHHRHRHIRIRLCKAPDGIHIRAELPLFRHLDILQELSVLSDIDAVFHALPAEPVQGHSQTPPQVPSDELVAHVAFPLLHKIPVHHSAHIDARERLQHAVLLFRHLPVRYDQVDRHYHEQEQDEDFSCQPFRVPCLFPFPLSLHRLNPFLKPEIQERLERIRHKECHGYEEHHRVYHCSCRRLPAFAAEDADAPPDGAYPCG